ncbi:uncharacterized protein DUF429 [Tibeticola sediminis]|jgi:hypothetical protein|uniref:Uncharacterized protein DUF429 n=1 Tax=Tibeticola sediminis TaxID=1917811 RepID=A0A3N4VJ51_9BURK|nr:DUF429 domain-containing protein [Tibeticola sediminis]RPE72994.1 uncharacterized protein DUF429 [Tibeticola sediminis]
MESDPLLLGCDFSSSPSPAKPIVVALGRWRPARIGEKNPSSPAENGTLLLLKLERFSTLEAFAQWLTEEREPWVGAFDFPFGLPRELVEALGWPTVWAACMDHYGAQPREALRELFRRFCAARPVGAKFAHRATDRLAGSSSSMKWVNPPVAWMMHAGVPLLRRAEALMPGLAPGRADRVALEAYPGMLARAVLGRRSYKGDSAAARTPERLAARQVLVAALEQGLTQWEIRLRMRPRDRAALLDDARGDRLDAVLCLAQAAWAWLQEQRLTGAGRRSGATPGWGLPSFDPLEGWIVGA